MSRRDSSPKVTLFPFLAVLVCTMGALILLLVVTTRMIRRQTLAELERSFVAPQVVEVEPQPTLAEPEPTLIDPQPTLALPEPLVSTELQPVTEPLLQAVPEPAFIVEPEVPPSAPAFPARLVWEMEREEILRRQAEQDAQSRHEWESKVVELREQRLMFLDQIRSKSDLVTRVKTEGEKVREQVARYEQTVEESNDKQKVIAEQLEQMATAAGEVTTQMRLLEDEILQLEKAPPPRPEYQFVTFDALTGTTRRPILIECTEDSATFAGERVTITADQLSGFTPEYNPLLAGARALTAYWTQQDGPQAPRPYVLLVVRPEGTVGFYVARKMLENLGEPFGYELVESDRPIHWPEPDAGAAEVCRKAVERVLADQVQMEQKFASRSLGVGRDKQFAGDDGSFWLPEVDELREPDEQVNFGGRTFSRRSTTPGSASPPRQPLSTLQQNRLPETSQNVGRIATIPDNPDNSPVPQGTKTGDPQELTGQGNRSTPVANAENNGLDPSFLDQLTAASERARASNVESLQSETSGAMATAESIQGTSRQGIRGATQGGEELPELPELLRQHASAAGGSGIAARSGTIGLERQIVVDISPQKIVIDDQVGLDIPAAMTTSQLQQLVAQGLDLQIRGWGASPGGFYWKPYLRIIVHPGGNSNLARLTELFRHWKLQWTVDHRLD